MAATTAPWPSRTPSHGHSMSPRRPTGPPFTPIRAVTREVRRLAPTSSAGRSSRTSSTRYTPRSRRTSPLHRPRRSGSEARPSTANSGGQDGERGGTPLPLLTLPPLPPSAGDVENDERRPRMPGPSASPPSSASPRAATTSRASRGRAGRLHAPDPPLPRRGSDHLRHQRDCHRQLRARDRLRHRDQRSPAGHPALRRPRLRRRDRERPGRVRVLSRRRAPLPRHARVLLGADLRVPLVFASGGGAVVVDGIVVGEGGGGTLAASTCSGRSATSSDPRAPRSGADQTLSESWCARALFD